MRLGELISTLEKADPDRVVPKGFANPMSYRGYYEQLAFEPAEKITVREMLAHAKSALNQSFEGYKGGKFIMDEHSECWIAEYGQGSADAISHILMEYMLGFIA